MWEDERATVDVQAEGSLLRPQDLGFFAVCPESAFFSFFSSPSRLSDNPYNRLQSRGELQLLRSPKNERREIINETCNCDSSPVQCPSLLLLTAPPAPGETAPTPLPPSLPPNPSRPERQRSPKFPSC